MIPSNEMPLILLVVNRRFL